MDTQILPQHNNVLTLILAMAIVAITAGGTMYLINSFTPLPTLPAPETVTLPTPAASSANKNGGKLCIQVITKACLVSNPSVCQDFGSPCSVPDGWKIMGPETASPSATLSPR